MIQQDMVAKIENCRRFGKESGVELAGRLLADKLPWKVPYIHVAGTNGKGSTSTYLASVLGKAGYRVGIYTSPHLIDFTERIRINGEKISRERANQLAGEVVNRGLALGFEAGMFDYATAMAVEYFTEQNCDIVVMETGLGGKLDATNALGVPEVAVITPIGMDHMQQLGDNLTAIAGEKAGIIKAGAPVVIARQDQEAEVVLVQACQEVETEYVLVQEAGLEAAAQMQLGLAGAYQVENAATALATIEMLRKQGWKLSEEAVIAGMAEARWPGRLERVQSAPEILLDGAHNIHGVRALRRSLAQMYPEKKLHLLMGVLVDKDYEEMLREMIPLAFRIDTVTLESERALQGEELSRLVREQGLPSESYRTVAEALKAVKEADPKETICIFGSLYFIGEVEELLGREL